MERAVWTFFIALNAACILIGAALIAGLGDTDVAWATACSAASLLLSLNLLLTACGWPK